ncbi:hypothetical protein HMPREF0262_01314 [Clostridium sp. ATCC 29733]|nr:hypothetical protein HMPREF0262_01314 [Clostridium sp. ATCC 29733]
MSLCTAPGRRPAAHRNKKRGEDRPVLPSRILFFYGHPAEAGGFSSARS